MFVLFQFSMTGITDIYGSMEGEGHSNEVEITSCKLMPGYKSKCYIKMIWCPKIHRDVYTITVTGIRGRPQHSNKNEVIITNC